MSLYDDAVLVMIPSAFKAEKLYSVKPTDGTGDFTVARADTATRLNVLGERETMAVNVPLLNYDSAGSCPNLLTQPQSINLYLNSATLVTQDVVTTATSYTVSFEGTGSVAFSGAYTGNLAAAGVGALDRVSLTFTSTAGTLTSTVTGSVINAQIENLAESTTYIATVGAAVTRVKDVVSLGDLIANNILTSAIGIIDNTIDATRWTYKYLGDNIINLYKDGIYAGLLPDPPPSSITIDKGETEKILMYNTNVSNTLLGLSTEATIDYSTAQGLSWNSATDTYARLGSISAIALSTSALDANLPIQAAMKRCLLNDDGTVNYYLDADNSALKADGSTASDLTGADGQVMVEIPKFWFKESLVGTVKSWYISLTYISGFELHPAFWKDGKQVDYRYMSAFEGGMWDASTGAMCAEASIPSSIYATGDKMTSVTGTWAKTNETRAEYRAMAAKRGTGWRQLDYYLHSAVQLLYLVEYADFDSQVMIGAGRTALSGGGWTADSYIGGTGLSVADGNGTNSVSNGGVNYLTDYMTYRGIENLFGNVYKMLDGIVWDGRWTGSAAAQPVYVTNNSTYFADQTSTNMQHLVDATYIGAVGGYIGNIENVTGFIPSAGGGSATTDICDYYYQYSTVGQDFWRVALVGGAADGGSKAGVFFVNAYDAWSHDEVGLAARLTY